jgi:hypothetical protein
MSVGELWQDGRRLGKIPLVKAGSIYVSLGRSSVTNRVRGLRWEACPSWQSSVCDEPVQVIVLKPGVDRASAEGQVWRDRCWE